MSVILLPSRFGGRQPQHVPSIDWGNPITRGLCFAALPQGGSFVNVRTNAIGVPTGAGLPTNANATGGRNMRFNGGGSTNSYINFGAGDLNAADIGRVGGGGATWFFWAAPTGQGGLAERNDTNTINAGWLVGIDSASFLHLSVEHSAANTNARSSIAITPGVYTSLAVRWGAESDNAQSHKFYIGGVDAGSTSTQVGSGTSGSDAANSLYLGRNSFGASNSSFAGDIEFAAFFKRVLAPSEIAALHADRYQIFKAPSRRLWAVPPVPSADLTKLVSYSVQGGMIDAASVSKTLGYSIQGGMVNAASLSKALSYSIQGGMVNAASFAKMVAYAVTLAPPPAAGQVQTYIINT